MTKRQTRQHHTLPVKCCCKHQGVGSRQLASYYGRELSFQAPEGATTSGVVFVLRTKYEVPIRMLRCDASQNSIQLGLGALDAGEMQGGVGLDPSASW